MILWLIAAAQLGQAPAPALPADIERRARSATVRIFNRTQVTESTGVIVDQRNHIDFWILTAAHVTKADDKLEVVFYPKGAGGDGPGVRNVKVIWSADPFDQDLAILKVESDRGLAVETLPLAPVGAHPAAKSFTAFSFAYAAPGGPESQAEKVLGAPVISKKAGRKGFQFWKCDSLPVQGRSGGPLIDSTGRLIGICSGGDDKATYFTHCDEIRNALIQANLARLTKPKEDVPKQ